MAIAQYPLYAASALAANSFARSSFAAAFPLFGIQMYESESPLRADYCLPPLTVVQLWATNGRRRSSHLSH
jgi:hypothetical protein